jgi:hypothetical protein
MLLAFGGQVNVLLAGHLRSTLWHESSRQFRDEPLIGLRSLTFVGPVLQQRKGLGAPVGR